MNVSGKIFFVHIPKTGGISIEEEFATAQLSICPAYRTQALLAHPCVEQYQVYRGHLFHYLKAFINPEFTFTLLRDPIERSISAFEHFKRDIRHRHHQLAVEAGSITAALAEPQLSKHFSNSMALYLGLDVDPFANDPDSAYIEALENQPLDTILARAKNALSAMDFIGFTEALPEAKTTLFQLLGIEHTPSFFTENRNPNKSNHSYTDELDKATLEALQAANAVDIELFQFALDLAKTRGWPTSSDASLAELQRIQQVARQNFLEYLSERPAVARINYTFSDAIAGDGWHNRETNGQLSWRFTGPEERATLFFPRLIKGAKTVSLNVVHAISERHFKYFRVILNGIELINPVHAGMVVTFNAADSVTAPGYTSLEIITPPAEMPASGDSRKLGIAFSSLEIY